MDNLDNPTTQRRRLQSIRTIVRILVPHHRASHPGTTWVICFVHIGRSHDRCVMSLFPSPVSGICQHQQLKAAARSSAGPGTPYYVNLMWTLLGGLPPHDRQTVLSSIFLDAFKQLLFNNPDCNLGSGPGVWNTSPLSCQVERMCYSAGPQWPLEVPTPPAGLGRPVAKHHSTAVGFYTDKNHYL